MSGFSADWLALREPADRDARARPVLTACKQYFAGETAVAVCDLGSGTGAAVPAFGPYLPPAQRWFLVDNDPDTLAMAMRLRTTVGVAIETVLADLATGPPLPAGCHLVTATALFDLASPVWIEALFAQLAARGLPLLATLTYDGMQSFAPAHPDDAAMIDAFNRHQRSDKGLGGPAAGPDAPSILRAAAARHGFRVHYGESPWRLDETRHAALIAELLRGWAAAVTEAGLAPPKLAADWLAARLAHTDRLTVGHQDIFAAPANTNDQ